MDYSEIGNAIIDDAPMYDIYNDRIMEIRIEKVDKLNAAYKKTGLFIIKKILDRDSYELCILPDSNNYLIPRFPMSLADSILDVMPYFDVINISFWLTQVVWSECINEDGSVNTGSGAYNYITKVLLNPKIKVMTESIDGYPPRITWLLQQDNTYITSVAMNLFINHIQQIAVANRIKGEILQIKWCPENQYQKVLAL